MILRWLDKYGTDDPDFREGQLEDRCPLCSRAVDEHVGIAPAGEEWAKWAHRWAAIVAILLG